MELALAFVCGILVGVAGMLLLFRSIVKQKIQQEETDDDWWKKGSPPPY